MSLNRWLGRGNGSSGFTVTWDAPETDADGNPASAITGYRVRWATKIDDGVNAMRSALVVPPSLTYSPDNLKPGPWYVWISAITATGESDISPPLQVTAV